MRVPMCLPVIENAGVDEIRSCAISIVFFPRPFFGK